MPVDSPKSELAAALRDFFISDDAKSLRSSYAAIEAACGNPFPGVEDWQQVEYAFARLFLGPKSLEAPPFASVYLENDGLVMGATTRMVRSVYEMMGLVSPWKNRLPEDHVSLELDAALAMQKAAESGDSGELRELRQFFVCRHMGSWIPVFVKCVSRAGSAHPAIIKAAELLRHWVGKEATVIEWQMESKRETGRVE